MDTLVHVCQIWKNSALNMVNVAVCTRHLKNYKKLDSHSFARNFPAHLIHASQLPRGRMCCPFGVLFSERSSAHSSLQSHRCPCCSSTSQLPAVSGLCPCCSFARMLFPQIFRAHSPIPIRSLLRCHLPRKGFPAVPSVTAPSTGSDTFSLSCFTFFQSIFISLFIVHL